MKKDPKIFLLHILERIGRVEKYIKDVDKNKFLKNEKIQDAVMINLLIIGEAIRNIPDDFQRKQKKVKWGEVVAMRNRLIHEYFGVNLRVVWYTPLRLRS
jgi:uncharacterized protein with HEPN domain